MSNVAGNSAFIYLGERSVKERTLLAKPDDSRPAVASDDAAQSTLERPEGWRPEGAGETLVASSCGAPQPAVARDDVALLALKDEPGEKTRLKDVFKRFTRRLSEDEGSLRKRRCMELTHRRS